MPTEDQRERDQMWRRIDSHGKQINDLERGLTEVKGTIDEHGRDISELSSAVRRAEAATNQVHLDLNTLIGQGRAIKKIVAGLSFIMIVIELLNTFADDLSLPL